LPVKVLPAASVLADGAREPLDVPGWPDAPR